MLLTVSMLPGLGLWLGVAGGVGPAPVWFVAGAATRDVDVDDTDTDTEGDPEEEAGPAVELLEGEAAEETRGAMEEPMADLDKPPASRSVMNSAILTARSMPTTTAGPPERYWPAPGHTTKAAA